MTTINVNLHGCPLALEAHPSRVVTLEVTTPEEALAAVRQWRNVRCDSPKCEGEHAKTEPHAINWGTALLRYSSAYTYTQPAAELWTRNTSGRLIVLQNVAGDRETRRILESQGFARIGTSARATIKAARGEAIQLDHADEWIADNVTADHTHHVAACGHVTSPCSDLTCFVREYPDPCAECRRIAAIEQADAAKQREHTQHICAECGDLTPAVGTFGRPCSKTLEEHDNGAHYCYACKTTVSAFPVGILADRPLAHCEAPDCAIIVDHGVKLCDYHAREAAAAVEPAPACGWNVATRKSAFVGCCEPAARQIAGRWFCEAHTAIATATYDPQPAAAVEPAAEVLECDRRGELVEPVVTVWDVQAEAEAVAQAAQDAPQSATMPATARTCGRATCDTRAHTAGGWRKRSMQPTPGAVPFDRDGWQLYCRHQVEAVEPARA